MVKSERRGDRIISAFTGRKAPAGSCRGGGAGHPGRPPWIKKTGSRPRSRDARTELRDGEYFVRLAPPATRIAVHSALQQTCVLATGDYSSLGPLTRPTEVQTDAARSPSWHHSISFALPAPETSVRIAPPARPPLPTQPPPARQTSEVLFFLAHLFITRRPQQCHVTLACSYARGSHVEKGAPRDGPSHCHPDTSVIVWHVLLLSCCPL